MKSGELISQVGEGVDEELGDLAGRREGLVALVFVCVDIETDDRAARKTAEELGSPSDVFLPLLAFELRIESAT